MVGDNQLRECVKQGSFSQVLVGFCAGIHTVHFPCAAFKKRTT